MRATILGPNEQRTRYVRRPVRTGAQQPVTFAQHFLGLTYGTDEHSDLRATWSALQSDVTVFQAVDVGGNAVDHTVTRSYLQTTGSRSVTLSTRAPGFRDAWRLDLRGYNTFLTATHTVTGPAAGKFSTMLLRDVGSAANARFVRAADSEGSTSAPARPGARGLRAHDAGY